MTIRNTYNIWFSFLISWLILSKKKSISKKFLNFHLTFRDFCKGNYSQFHLRGFYFLHWLFDSLIEFFRSKFMKKFSGVNLLCKLFEMVLQQLFVYYFLLYIVYRKYGVGNSKKKRIWMNKSKLKSYHPHLFPVFMHISESITGQRRLAFLAFAFLSPPKKKFESSISWEESGIITIVLAA